MEREIRDAGGEATYIEADVRVDAQVRGFVDRVASRYGGIGGGKLPHEMSVEECDDVQATNARGVFLAIKYEIPHMLKAQRGVIICTSSSAAEQRRVHREQAGGTGHREVRGARVRTHPAERYVRLGPSPDALPPEKHSPTLRALVNEIRAGRGSPRHELGRACTRNSLVRRFILMIRWTREPSS